MNQTLLSNLIYFSQVSIFAGIALLIFAWVEKKILLEKIGQLLFVLLGIIAAWVIASGQIVVPEITDGQLPKEARLVSFFYGLIGASILAAIAFLMRLRKIKYSGWVNVILVLISLFLFFTIYELLKS